MLGLHADKQKEVRKLYNLPSTHSTPELLVDAESKLVSEAVVKPTVIVQSKTGGAEQKSLACGKIAEPKSLADIKAVVKPAVIVEAKAAGAESNSGTVQSAETKKNIFTVGQRVERARFYHSTASPDYEEDILQLCASSS